MSSQENVHIRILFKYYLYIFKILQAYCTVQHMQKQKRTNKILITDYFV